ncbi:MAG: FAD-dependent oxidoreductase [Cyanobacteria bacterium J06633_2]
MAESIPDGFTELDNEELVVEIEKVTNQLAMAQSSLEETKRFSSLLQNINKSVSEWASVKGRREKRQQARRHILVTLRDIYMSWLLDDPSPETTPSIERAKSKRQKASEQGIRPRMGQIINSCAVKAIPGVYILGCFDHKKTIHTQQRRAVALVNALSKFGEITPEKRIAVIGGGIGGLTAARAAAHHGATVTLFEKQRGLVPIQSGNTQRIIHPHIYDWPDEGSENETSELPFLNWSAGACNDVFHRVTDEFNNYVANTASEILSVKDETSISSVCIAEPAPDRARVEISSDDGTFHDFFDIVLVAVGFGLETRSAEAGGVISYWQNDDLEQVIGYTKDDPEITLVSGSQTVD